MQVLATNQGPQRRYEELRANQVLGIHQTHFLDFEDGNFTEDEVDAAVWQIMDRVPNLGRFDNIITFGEYGYTGHPDHMTAFLVAERLFEYLPNVKFLTSRIMSDEERALWEPYFIPIPQQGHVATRALPIQTVMSHKELAIRQYESQLEIDGLNHIWRMQNMRPEEHYTVLTK